MDIHTEELDNQIGAQLADKLRGELELIDGVYPEFDKEEYLKGELAPVFFGSALNNFGVQELLDCFVEIAPSPRPVKAEEREVDPEEPKFTGFIFKITANIDPNHRSCIAFCKICSGKFVRNAPYLHVRHGKTMRFSSPTQFMAQRKTTVDEAWAGDIIGLPDNGTFKIGDTLTEGEALHFKGLPSFSPEMFKYIENADPMKQKQLAKGIDQLMDEGVAQLFSTSSTGVRLSVRWGSCSSRSSSIVWRMNTVRSAVGSRSVCIKPAGLRAMMRLNWKPSRSANTSTWPKTARVGMCSWPIADMCCRWRRWTSSISSSTLRVSSKLYDFC